VGGVLSAAKNYRELMPVCTAFIDHMRDVFGNPAGIHAIENGHEVRWGRQSPGPGFYYPVILEPREPVVLQRREKRGVRS
jgi:hypothetical protein